MFFVPIATKDTLTHGGNYRLVPLFVNQGLSSVKIPRAIYVMPSQEAKNEMIARNVGITETITFLKSLGMSRALRTEHARWICLLILRQNIENWRMALKSVSGQQKWIA